MRRLTYMRVVLKGQSLVAMAARASRGSAELSQPRTRCVPRLCTVRAKASASPTLHAVDSRQFSRETPSRVQCCRRQEHEWDGRSSGKRWGRAPVSLQSRCPEGHAGPLAWARTAPPRPRMRLSHLSHPSTPREPGTAGRPSAPGRPQAGSAGCRSPQPGAPAPCPPTLRARAGPPARQQLRPRSASARERRPRRPGAAGPGQAAPAAPAAAAEAEGARGAKVQGGAEAPPQPRTHQDRPGQVVRRQDGHDARGDALRGERRSAGPGAPGPPPPARPAPAALTSSPEHTDTTLAAAYSGVTARRAPATCRSTEPCTMAPSTRLPWPSTISPSPVRISRRGSASAPAARRPPPMAASAAAARTAPGQARAARPGPRPAPPRKRRHSCLYKTVY